MHLHVVDGNLKHRDVTINNWGVSGTPSGAQRRYGPHPEEPSITTQKTAIRKKTRWDTWSVGSIVLFHILPSSPPPSPSFEFHPLSLLPSAQFPWSPPHSSCSAHPIPKSQSKVKWTIKDDTAKMPKNLNRGRRKTFSPFRTLEGPLRGAFTQFYPVPMGEGSPDAQNNLNKKVGFLILPSNFTLKIRWSDPTYSSVSSCLVTADTVFYLTHFHSVCSYPHRQLSFTQA